MQDELIARAEAWLAEDPDPETREELAELIAAKDVTELTARFTGTLQFGTAGLRGELGAGPMRMNRAVVIRAAAGLAAYLKKQGETDGLVVIGYDARHKSADFARDTAAVMTGAGLRAAVLPAPSPPRSWRTPYGTSAPRPAWRSPPATTRPATTATRSTWATVRRSSPRRTPRSPPRSTPSAASPTSPARSPAGRPSTRAS